VAVRHAHHRPRRNVSDNSPGDVVEGGVDAISVTSISCEDAIGCLADVTGPKGLPDGNVDALDLLLLISQWGSPCQGPCTADVTGPLDGVPDGAVDSLDLLQLIAEWGMPGNCGV
jgi:hypothetical protein